MPRFSTVLIYTTGQTDGCILQLRHFVNIQRQTASLLTATITNKVCSRLFLWCSVTFSNTSLMIYEHHVHTCVCISFIFYRRFVHTVVADLKSPLLFLFLLVTFASKDLFCCTWTYDWHVLATTSWCTAWTILNVLKMNEPLIEYHFVQCDSNYAQILILIFFEDRPSIVGLIATETTPPSHWDWQRLHVLHRDKHRGYAYFTGTDQAN